MYLLFVWNFLLTTISQPIYGKSLFYWSIISLALLSWMIILRIAANILVGKPIIQKIFKNQIIKFYFPYFPAIDYILIISFLYAWTAIPLFFPAYFIFFSCLIITIYTDLQHMLISRFVSIYLVPAGILLSSLNLTLISPLESMISACAGYAFLWIINKIFYMIKKHDGLGQGDLDLLAFIGSFIGLVGLWITILVGSTLGTFIGCGYMLCSKKTISVVPFGLFLAIAAMFFMSFQPWLFSYLAS